MKCSAESSKYRTKNLILVIVWIVKRKDFLPKSVQTMIILSVNLPCQAGGAQTTLRWTYPDLVSAQHCKSQGEERKETWKRRKKQNALFRGKTAKGFSRDEVVKKYNFIIFQQCDVCSRDKSVEKSVFGNFGDHQLSNGYNRNASKEDDKKMKII